MKITYLIPAFVVVSVFAQQPRPNSQIKLVAVGQIAKVDEAKRSFELRSVKESARQRTGESDDIGVNIGFGRFPDATVPGRPRSGERDRFPDDPTAPDEPDAPRLPETTVTKVFLTDATACKADGEPILCDDLKITDSVRVTGDEKLSDARGKGLYATEIVRTRTR